MTTKIHEACAADGRCIISQGTLKPAAVLAKMLDALRELAPAEYQQVTMPGAGFSVIPSYALDDSESDWWNSADADAVLTMLIEALNEHTPEGFAFQIVDHDTFGFFPFDVDIDDTSPTPVDSIIRALRPVADEDDEQRARVQLEVHTTPEGAAKLRERFAAGNLSLAGIGVLSIEDAMRRPASPCSETCPGWCISEGDGGLQIEACTDCWHDEADAPSDDYYAAQPVCVAALKADPRYQDDSLEAPSQSVLDCMFAWHGGQGSKLYAAASCWLGGHTVSRETAEAALGELERFETDPNFDDDNHVAIADLREHLGVQDIAEPTPLDRFVADLIETKEPIPWRRGAPRKVVRERLRAIGFDLAEDGTDWNPRLKRFYACPMPKRPEDIEFRDGPDAPVYHMLARHKCRVLTRADVGFELTVEADEDPETGDCDPEDAPDGWWIVIVKASWVSPMGVTHEGVASLGSCDLSGDNTAERVAQEHELHQSALESLNESLRSMILDANSVVTYLRIP